MLLAFQVSTQRVNARRVRTPVAAGILDDNVVVLVDAAHGSRGGQRLEHAIRPAAVAMLQRLDDLQVQVDVDQVSDLQAAGVPVPILLTWRKQRGEKRHQTLRLPLVRSRRFVFNPKFPFQIATSMLIFTKEMLSSP